MRAITAENLSKEYVIGSPGTGGVSLREALADGLRAPLRKLRRRGGDAPARERFWALKDVSFDVRPGEAVGIIGRNGAGKSTLLKILSRITDPTAGRAELRGRVSSLLEVGTGFHPELTGRENVFLNGAILGMGRADIRKRFDEIVAFSDVGRFIDTPVKRYSSGMYVRLAFAIAAHLEPEILIVDEVLAVGDAQFQRKCLGKMEDVGREGRTVLFVSHNMQAVSTLTRRCLVLSRGRCVYEGPTAGGISAYLGEGGDAAPVYADRASAAEPKVTRVELRTSEPDNVQVNGKPMEIIFEIAAPAPIDGASLAFQALNPLKQPLLHLWLFDSERPFCREAGTVRLRCVIPKVRLYMGRYTLTVHFAEGLGRRKFQTIEGICPFEVTMFGRHRDYEWRPEACAYLEDAEWTVGGA